MTKKTLISVIVPLYNKEKYIKECIESILSQKFTSQDNKNNYSLELLVIDDCSTDNSYDIARHISDIRLTIIRHNKNKGAGEAINTGIRMSSGEYITWLGADDVLCEDSLSTRINAMKESPDDCDILYTNYNQIDSNSKITDTIKVHLLPQESMIRNLCISNFVNFATVIMKREIIDTLGLYNTEMKCDNDFEFMIRCLHHGYKFKHIPNVTVNYRIHGDQLSFDTELMRSSKDYYRSKIIKEYTPNELMSDVITSWSTVYKEMAGILLNQMLYESSKSAMEMSLTADNYKPVQHKKPITSKPKLAFFCSTNDTFLIPIIKHLETKYDVTRFTGNTIQEMNNLMQWSDISWFEWCDSLLLNALTLTKSCRIICRLHSYEAFTPIITQINYNKIDDLIFVAPHIRDIVKQRVKHLPRNIIIYNGVDLEKYTLRDREKGFNLAYIGYLNDKKNIPLLAQCMKSLLDIDNRYTLHIAGQWQDYRQELYFNHIIKEMGIDNNIIFHGWIKNVNSWLEDKHYTVSTSLLESFCYGIADAMATGCKPIIHNFIGAKELYGEWKLWNTPSDFTELITEDSYTPFEYRKFIEDNYSQEKQFQNIEKLLSIK